MKMRDLVIRDVSVRSSQQVSNEDVDHESKQEVGQLSTIILELLYFVYNIIIFWVVVFCVCR